MPELIAREPVEEFKLTNEQRAFYKTYQKIAQVQEMIDKGLRFQAGKLQALQTIAQDMEGKRKELLLRAPEQSTLDVEDEGMVEQRRGGSLSQGGLTS